MKHRHLITLLALITLMMGCSQPIVKAPAPEFTAEPDTSYDTQEPSNTPVVRCVELFRKKGTHALITITKCRTGLKPWRVIVSTYYKKLDKATIMAARSETLVFVLDVFSVGTPILKLMKNETSTISYLLVVKVIMCDEGITYDVTPLEALQFKKDDEEDDEEEEE